jgi:hypothetical protein
MGGNIKRTTVTVTGATGGAGSATANADTDIIVDGYIVAVYLEYTDSPPGASTDVIIEEANNSPAVSVLTVTNAATDGWFYPRAAAVNTAGSAITNSNEKIATSDYLNVSIAQANNDDGVTATIVWESRR